MPVLVFSWISTISHRWSVLVGQCVHVCSCLRSRYVVVSVVLLLIVLLTVCVTCVTRLTKPLLEAIVYCIAVQTSLCKRYRVQISLFTFKYWFYFVRKRDFQPNQRCSLRPCKSATSVSIRKLIANESECVYFDFQQYIYANNKF